MTTLQPKCTSCCNWATPRTLDTISDRLWYFLHDFYQCSDSPLYDWPIERLAEIEDMQHEYRR